MELWDLYDKNRNLTGKTHIRGEKIEKGFHHLVVEIWTINTKGKILLTQRHPNKNHGLLWECTRGAVTAGENSIEGAIRELYEEIGLKVEKSNLKLINTSTINNYFMDTYVNLYDFELENIALQKIEVVDAKIVTIEEFEEMNSKGLIVPSIWFRYEQYKHKLLEYLPNN